MTIPENIRQQIEDEYCNIRCSDTKFRLSEAASFGYNLAMPEISALKKQNQAYKLCLELSTTFKNHAEKKAFENYAAKLSVDSERQMNAILTDENEKLQKEIYRLQNLLTIPRGY